jgi:protein-S-isoprenylcysteine O-methyltransferase Ste14
MTKHSSVITLVRIVGFALTLIVCWWVLDQRFDQPWSIVIIVGGLLAIFPVVWIGRMMLDAQPTTDGTAWATTFVHYAFGVFGGAAIIEAIKFGQVRPGWMIPLPPEIGWVLMVVTGTALLLTIANLALRGLGAPFALALSQRLAIDWLYAWTRNPMVLSFLAFLIAVGLWLRSVWFVLWVAALVTPAWIVFLKAFEERELEIRFGASYLEYKARTPMLWPRKPKNRAA